MRNDTTACVAIGSNVAPFQRIPRCMAALTEVRDSRLIAEPGWYRTKPRGIEEQESFVNLVDALYTGLYPTELPSETPAIEARLGRVRTARNGPRTIEIDVLLFGADVVDDEHPGTR